MSLSRLFLAARLALVSNPQRGVVTPLPSQQGSEVSVRCDAMILAKSDGFGRPATHATTLAKSDKFGQPPFRKTLPALGVLCLLLIAFAMTPHSLRAQSTSATLNGQITDPSGKVVPGTAVQAVNIDTNITYPSKSNATGIYVIPNLPPGRYRLVVTKDGFKQINKTDITLNVQDDLEQNFALEVGSTSESVTVEGSGVNMNNKGQVSGVRFQVLASSRCSACCGSHASAEQGSGLALGHPCDKFGQKRRLWPKATSLANRTSRDLTLL